MTHSDFIVAVPEQEAEHRRIVANHHGEELEIFGQLHVTTSAGFPLIGDLPGFGERDHRTISAALFSRSFKSLHCAVDCAMRGYYSPAITLVRTVYENTLTHFEVMLNPASVAALFDDHEEWWKKRSFMRIAEDIDRRFEERGLDTGVAEMWREEYGTLSLFAHPRTQGTSLEFGGMGSWLAVAPVWDEQHCHMTLAFILMGSRFNLIAMRAYVNASGSSWDIEAGNAIQAATEWIKKQ